MGTWATDAFGNDYAMDWAQDLHEYKTLELVETTLDNVIDSTEAELEAPFAAEALAALEVIARLLGKPGEDDPATAEVDEWVAACKKKVTPPLLEKARLAFEQASWPSRRNCASCGRTASISPTGRPTCGFAHARAGPGRLKRRATVHFSVLNLHQKRGNPVFPHFWCILYPFATTAHASYARAP